MLAFYSDDPSLNPAEAYSFYVKFMFENNDYTQKDLCKLDLKTWQNVVMVTHFSVLLDVQISF